MDQPTQTTHPVKAALRTVVQVWIPLTLSVMLAIPPIVNAVVEGTSAIMPDAWEVWLLAGSTVISLLAGTLARIFAIPAVNELLTKIGLGAVPRAPRDTP